MFGHKNLRYHQKQSEALKSELKFKERISSQSKT